MDYQAIQYCVADNVATLTLNRPDKLNALTTGMMLEMMHAFDRIDEDDDVRAVIVTGAGKAFCAGADIAAGANGFHDGDMDALRNPDGSVNYSAQAARDNGGILGLRIFALTKPVIAAINGASIGIGATMTLPMDIRLASDKARFGFVFTRRGIVPEAASSYFLPRVVGMSQALEWCFSGRLFDANEALAGNLVRSIHAPEDLLPAAHALAREIAENTAPVSVALTRQMLWRGLGMSHPMEAHRIESRAILARTASADAAEGVASFLEKRAAQFPDKASTHMPDFYPWWSEEEYN